jgi:competence protein ComEA
MLPESQDKQNWEKVLYKYRYPLVFLLIGIILTGVGILLSKTSLNSSDKIEILEEPEIQKQEIIIEVAGAVEEPGVYKLSSDARTEDALIAAGGVSADADRDWMEKFLNRAQVLQDGQKIYIPNEGEQSEVLSASNSGVDQSVSSTFKAENGELININTASASELESLWGIGPVYAQNIIEHRPYSKVEELLEKKVLKENVYERNKNLLTVN